MLDNFLELDDLIASSSFGFPFIHLGIAPIASLLYYIQVISHIDLSLDSVLLPSFLLLLHIVLASLPRSSSLSLTLFHILYKSRQSWLRTMFRLRVSQHTTPS